MRFGVCGPLQVQAADGIRLPIGTRKQGLVLALLLVNANRPVTLQELVDEVWPDAPPVSAVANVRGYAGWWRRLFDSAEPGRGRLVRDNAGYLLSIDTDELDLKTFAGHAAAGRDAWRAGDAKVAAARFVESLACWRGPMLAGLPHGPVLAARCAAAHEERLAVLEELAYVYLEGDEPRAAANLLHDHVRVQPLRERARLLLMRALYRLGDAPAALATYREGRAVLSEQLGLEPGAELQRLHQVIVAGEPDRSTRSPVSVAAPAPAERPVPAQLPLDVFGFTGRASELRQLDTLLAAAHEQPTAVVISAIAGTAGVGKTATAVHWAHRVREEFPDGQLYVNLRGFDPTGTPVPPAQAVRGFLDAFDVPASRIPADLDAQIGLYRSLLANRRVLVILDNARDADQVRPLLPGSPGCLVLVTSRNRLAGLVAGEGARSITLDLLTPAEAHALLARRLGADRVAAEPDAAEEIITRCARLPLALAIIAARAATRPRLTLAALAAELSDARHALDVLADDDPVTDVRAVFAASYRALSGPAARLFRL
ncbi:MAG TPA: BTAD domain-containing putative transcriptional regulator, partial [Pilimelia sp.]|nr:BTAD domain-containing putative transcriptional regulator [Pilimelia sp.]